MWAVEDPSWFPEATTQQEELLYYSLPYKLTADASLDALTVDAMLDISSDDAHIEIEHPE